MIEVLIRQKCSNVNCDEGVILHPLWVKFYNHEAKIGRELDVAEYFSWWAANGCSSERIPEESKKCPTCKGTGKEEMFVDINTLKIL